MMMNFWKLLFESAVLTSASKEFEETEEYEKGFSNHYRQHLAPLVSDFENSRVACLKVTRRNAIKYLPIMLLTSALTFYFFFQSSVVNIPIFLLLNIAILFGGYVLIMRSAFHLNSTIKAQIFPRIVEFFGDFKYQAIPPNEFSVHELMEYGSIPKHDQVVAEDYITGVYKTVNIELMEVTLSGLRSVFAPGIRTYAYHGLIIKFSFKKNLAYRGIIRTDKRSLYGPVLGGVLTWLDTKFHKPIGDTQRVRLENSEFEKAFEVFSDDQLASRYILTNAFLSRLMRVRNAFGSASLFGGKVIDCGILNNSMVMFIHTSNNMFEPGPITEPEDLIDDSKRFLSEIQSIFDVADLLKLDTDTGL